ncbi:MAG TPA: hypothetical protein P5290_04540 [Candidatus Methanomethylicus sp.]|nr:hypothetical protein [Candidatus Methanomethylicus sp.]
MNLERPHRHGNLDIQGCGISAMLVAREALQPNATKELLGRLVEEIASNGMSRGALAVGHIKAILKAGEEFVHADTIGVKYGTSTSGEIRRPINRAELTVNSIMVGLPESVIREITVKAIRDLFESHGAKVMLEGTKHDGGASHAHGNCHGPFGQSSHSDKKGLMR